MDLIKVRGVEVQIDNVNGILVTTSNRVAEELEVLHKNLLVKINEYVEKFSSAESSAQFYIPSDYKTKDGRTVKNYLITEKGIAQLIGGYSSAVPKAFDLNVAYINKFEEMKQTLQNNYKVPTNFKEALQLALEQQEQIEKMNNYIEKKKPALFLAEAIKNSTDLILVRELAKIISQNGIVIGEKKLFKWLRDNKFLIKKQGSDYNLPTQRAIEQGLMRVIERAVTNGESTKISKTPKITSKGQEYFVNKILGGADNGLHDV